MYWCIVKIIRDCAVGEVSLSSPIIQSTENGFQDSFHINWDFQLQIYKEFICDDKLVRALRRGDVTMNQLKYALYTRTVECIIPLHSGEWDTIFRVVYFLYITIEVCVMVLSYRKNLLNTPKMW